MFDGINALYKIPERDSRIAALTCWEVLINEQTGQKVNDSKAAVFRGLHLTHKPSAHGGYNFIIKGSLHKWFNAGTDNAGRFSMADVQTAVNSFCYVFEIAPERVELHGLEIGINIPLPFPALRILKNAICYKGRSFTPMDKRNVRLGIVCSLSDYEVKMYDKAVQSKTSGNMLRLEVKVNKMRFLNAYGFDSLADLTDTRKAYATRQVLADVLDNIMWTDTAANLNRMNDREQKQWLHLSNPKSWEALHKVKAFRQRERLKILFTAHAKFDTGKELKRLFSDTPVGSKKL